MKKTSTAPTENGKKVLTDGFERKKTMKIKLNDDSPHVEKIRKALERNNGYCPCAIERSDDTKCMCREFREQKSGMCHCGLYIKEGEQ